MFQVGAPREADVPPPCDSDGSGGKEAVVVDKVRFVVCLSQPRQFGFCLWEETDAEITCSHLSMASRTLGSRKKLSFEQSSCDWIRRAWH